MNSLNNLPSAAKSRLEVKGADYTVGWNDGHDVIYGKSVTSRATFSANPIFDVPYEQYAGTLISIPTDSAILPLCLSVGWLMLTKID
jgi:hypothetical protein